MLNHTIKVVGRLRVLLITVLLLNSVVTFGQLLTPIDSSNFKRDFEALLKKYNLQGKGYSLNVQSVNQKGGQTAFVINNNYYGDSTADSTNFIYKIDTLGGQKILSVYPRKGVWTTPFVAADSLKKKGNFFNPGIGVVISVSGFDVMIENKWHSFRGAGKTTPCGIRSPVIIYLDDSDPNDSFLFGDLDNPNKTYTYINGKIAWASVIESKK